MKNADKNRLLKAHLDMLSPNVNRPWPEKHCRQMKKANLNSLMLALAFIAMMGVLFIKSAFANEPPQIVSPSGDLTVTEGEAVAISFKVHEPDNDVVDYYVEWIKDGVVQNSLPTGAVLETNSKTAEQRFVWWPDLTQAGSYDFRFRVVDEKGAEAERTVTVTVAERTRSPAIKITKAYPMVDYYESLRKPLSVDPVRGT